MSWESYYRQYFPVSTEEWHLKELLCSCKNGLFILLTVISCLLSLGKNLFKFQCFPTFSFVEKEVGNPSHPCNAVKSLQHESQTQITVSRTPIFMSLKTSWGQFVFCCFLQDWCWWIFFFLSGKSCLGTTLC